MISSSTLDGPLTDRLLVALGEQLGSRAEQVTLVIVGGSALIALGLVDRATKDVDVVALVDENGIRSADPFPQRLVVARDAVARDFGLPVEWLNAGPAPLVDLGLPGGLLDRAERRDYGDALTVMFASRLDQVHFKLYAAVDQGAGKHFDDLRALAPTEDELLAAAGWSRTHDSSEGYLSVLGEVLAYFGVPDGSLDL